MALQITYTSESAILVADFTLHAVWFEGYAAADIVCVIQLFVGRVAMLGFAAELIGEELTGVTQFSSLSTISDVVAAVLLMSRQ